MNKKLQKLTKKLRKDLQDILESYQDFPVGVSIMQDWLQNILEQSIVIENEAKNNE